MTRMRSLPLRVLWFLKVQMCLWSSSTDFSSFGTCPPKTDNIFHTCRWRINKSKLSACTHLFQLSNSQYSELDSERIGFTQEQTLPSLPACGSSRLHTSASGVLGELSERCGWAVLSAGAVHWLSLLWYFHQRGDLSGLHVQGMQWIVADDVVHMSE